MPTLWLSEVRRGVSQREMFRHMDTPNLSVPCRYPMPSRISFAHALDPQSVWCTLQLDSNCIAYIRPLESARSVIFCSLLANLIFHIFIVRLAGAVPLPILPSDFAPSSPAAVVYR